MRSFEAPIAADEIQALLHNKLIGTKIFAFNQLSSTNDSIRRLARNHEAEGAVVIADAQTRGRGRHRREWLSPPGKGLWLSVLLRPTVYQSRLGLISLLSALAVAESIAKETGIETQLKWPNDVLLNSKKVCGILIESESQNGSPACLSLGIGINVNQTANDFPEAIRNRATSLFLEAGRRYSRAQLLVSVLHELEKFYQLFLNGRHELIRTAWMKRCVHLNQQVKIVCGNLILVGAFEEIDRAGEIILRTNEGEVRRLQAGEVTQLGLD